MSKDIKDLEKTMDDMEQRVLLLALYKRNEEENFNDIIAMLEDSRVFSRKEGKKFLKNLKALNYINEEGLTLVGIEKAKEVELEFKI